MNRNIRLSIIFVASSFAIGLSYGFWQATQKKKLAQASPLRVLCHENWLDKGELEVISSKLETPIELFTYRRPIELVRQLANTNGKIDVICTSSFLTRSLIQSHWLKNIDPNSIPNLKLISVDFTHLPYDPEANHTIPLFWNLYGFWGQKDDRSVSYKQALQNKSLTVWGDSLNLLHLLTASGIDIVGRLELEQDKNLEADIKQFIQSLGHGFTPKIPVNMDSALAQTEWVQIPLAQVARYIDETSAPASNSNYRFSLPSDGGFLEVGVLAVGERSEKPKQAMNLINEIISPEHALQVHRRLNAGAVHLSLGHLDSVAPLQRAKAIRQFPLNRLKFPEIKIEAIPRFQKIYDQVAPSDRN